MTSTRVSRSVVRSFAAVETPEGDCAIVARSIGSSQLRNFTPFLLLDTFRVTSDAAFPDHPHRGQTTLTYALDGDGYVSHEDSKGNKGILEKGDLQFMIAGKGIMHSEIPHRIPGKSDPWGLQLWIDLPSKHKLCEPSYQDLKASEIPHANPTLNVLVKVICGESDGNAQQGVVKSPVRPLGGCWFLDYHFSKKGEKVFQRIPRGWNAFVYTLVGEALVGDMTSPVQPIHTVILSSSATETGIDLISVTEKTRLLVIAGEPLNQPIFQHGPFVMDSQQGIQQAFVDFQRGINGFEGAREWRSRNAQERAKRA